MSAIEMIMEHARTSPIAWKIALAGSLVFIVVLSPILVIFVDKPILMWIQEQEGHPLISIAHVVTNAGRSTWPLILSLSLFLFFRYIWRATSLAQFPLFIFLSVAISGLSVNLFKVILGRARPKMLLGEDSIYGFDPLILIGRWHSFPSGHANTAMALSLAVALIYPRIWPLALVFALIVSASRVVVSAHFLSDVIAGAALAIPVTLLLAYYVLPQYDKPAYSKSLQKTSTAA